MKKRSSLPPTRRPPRCLEVRSSRISGKGLFALDRVERGARILEYTGARVTYEEGLRRYEGTVPFHTFLIMLDDERSIDGGVGGSDARFINHSCQPNCIAYIEGGRVFIYARRPIPAGGGGPREVLGLRLSVQCVPLPRNHGGRLTVSGDIEDRPSGARPSLA